MKVINLLLILSSVFVIWSCEEDSSLNVVDDNGNEIEVSSDLLLNNSASSNSYSPLRSILYDVHFNRETGEFTLFYLPLNIWNMIFKGASIDATSGKRSGGVLIFPPIEETRLPDEKPVEIQIPETRYGPGSVLTFKVDIFVTDNKKVIYPPVPLPDFDITSTGTPEAICSPTDSVCKTIPTENDNNETESSNILLKDNNGSNNTVIARIINGQVHFQIDPNSSFINSDKSRIEMGHYDVIYYQTDWLGPDYNINHVYSMYKLGYLICVDLTLIKGNPPVNNKPECTYTSNTLYNIIVSTSEKKIYLKYPKESLDTGSLSEQFIYHDSSYCIYSDGSFHILDSINGKEIAQYPSDYSIINTHQAEEEQHT